jgi:hypothetical protein
VRVSSSRWTIEQSMKEFNRIKERYQTQSINDMNDAWTTYNSKILSVNELDGELDEFFVHLSTTLKPIEHESIDIFSYVHRDQPIPFRTWQGFLVQFVQQCDRLKQIRRSLLLAIETLERQPNDEQIGNMAACSKCGFDHDACHPTSCLFCRIEPIMKSYNCR